jgi:PAS domain S-box-containing protein
MQERTVVGEQGAAGATRELHILFVEDDPADLQLVQRELRSGGVFFRGQTACNAQEFARCLGEAAYDIVLSDFRLPGWTGLEALRALRDRGLDTPFILITGTLGDETAVECMKLGANDYILKDHLSRLPHAVRHAVESQEMEERQRRITEELWSSETKLGALLAQLPAVIWTTDLDLRLTSAMGASVADYRALGGLDLARNPEGTGSAARRKCPCYVAHQRALRAESAEYEVAGATRVFSARVEPLRDTLGNIVGCLGLALDVTERKRSEERLRSRELEAQRARRTLETLIASAPVAIVALDSTDSVCTWNPAAERVFGWKAEEVLGRPLPNVPPFRSEEHRLLKEVLLQGGSFASIETQRQRKDGALVDVSLSASAMPLQDRGEFAAGQPRMLAVLTDITERKRAEQERQRLETAIEQSAECIVITNPQGIIQYVNPAFCATTGYSREEAVGRKTSILRSGKHDRAFYANLWRTILNGQTWRGEIQNRRKDGAVIPMEAVITPVRGPQDEITAFIGIHEDVTERRTLERQLYQSQKFEAIGQLAGGIAHDFNNVLAAILGMAELGLLEAPEGTRIRERLEKIAHHGGRAVALTKQLLAFSRRQVLERRELDLNHSVAEVSSLLGEALGKDVELVTRLAPDLASVQADRAQIEQVLMNLCVNARDAMPRGGRLVIETSNVTLDGDVCRSKPGSRPGNYVCLSVSDTGTGMDSATLERIFEPFFTTKPQGQGTGLGLATVYGIVKQHGGFVNVYSEPGEGTLFHVYLPAVAASRPAAPSPETLAPLRGGSETLLVADDHDGLRELVREALEGLGYTVLVAQDGEEAVERFREATGKVDLLILDVVMPRLRGPDAYLRIRELRPGIPVIFCTGYNPESAQMSAISGHRVFQKPYSTRELARAIRELLDGSAKAKL